MNDRMNRTARVIGFDKLTGLGVSVALLSLTACGGGESDSGISDLSNLQGVPPELGEANTDTIAKPDVVETFPGEAVTIPILTNDSFAPGARIQLIDTPTNGTATLNADGTVKYVANTDFEGTDSVTYVLVDADGNQSSGTIYIAVKCADCVVTPIANAAPSLSGAPYCVGENADPDGDGFGWENNASCEIPGIGAAVGPLFAKADSISLQAGSVTALLPLSNDSIADRANVQFSIDVEPLEGRIQAVDTGIVVYAAPENYTGSDSIVYRIKDASGETSVASIDIDISCATCTEINGLRLSWAANPLDEAVDGYRVYFGPDENTHTASLLSEVDLSSFNGTAPQITYDLIRDLNVTGSDGGCFRIQAYRGAEVSEQSNATCFTRT